VELQRLATELREEATGRSHRSDPVAPRTGGPAGNARLTAWTGLVLLVLLLAELITLLDVRGLISWHVALGVILIPPALLKTAVTGWRFLRYYGRNEPYRTSGPPILPLRVLGPFVVAATLGLLGSGLLLILLGENRSRQDGLAGYSWVNVHQALFIVFAVVAGLHVLARVVPAVLLVRGRRKESPGRPGNVPGGGARLGILLGTLAVAALAAVLLLPGASSWQQERFHGGDDGPPPRSAQP
jgi:hypothetical protein